MAYKIRIRPCACDRAISDMAEIALQAQSLQEFRTQIADGLCRWIGAEMVTLSASRDGVRLDVTNTAGDAPLLLDRLPHYNSEFARDELGWMMERKTIVDDEVIRLGRRAQMAMYGEYLQPRGVKTIICYTWWDQGRLHCVSLARTGHVRPLQRKDAEVLDRLAPMLVVGDRLHDQAGRRAPAAVDVWAQEQGLTGGERRVMDLVVRGLTNGEIGAVLGSSCNTVRNQLSSVFRKLGVSTRTELVFVLSNVEQGADVSVAARVTPSLPKSPWLGLFAK
jgi:DNA-binding CsgD family transcriptional regulator